MTQGKTATDAFEAIAQFVRATTRCGSALHERETVITHSHLRLLLGSWQAFKQYGTVLFITLLEQLRKICCYVLF